MDSSPSDLAPWRRFALGARYPFRGAHLLASTPALWRWVLAPALITTLTLTGALWAVIRYTPAFLAWIWPVPPGAGAIQLALWWVIAVLLIGSLATLSAVGAWFASGLVAVPFLDQLSQRVESMQIGTREEPTSWSELAGDLALSLLHTVLGLLLWLVVMAALLVVGLIPAVGPPLHGALSLSASALFACREMMDGPMSRRRMGFVHKLRVIGANLPQALGFGAIVAVVLWIPLMNFLLLPVAVTGGTLMFVDLERHGCVPPR